MNTKIMKRINRHSENILIECFDKFGEHVYKDAKDFLIKQTERK